MIVRLCDTQIGDNPPIVTKKLTKTKTKKSVKKSADFFFLEKSADFLVGGEIVWWDTSLTWLFVGNHLLAGTTFLCFVYSRFSGHTLHSVYIILALSVTACP